MCKKFQIKINSVSDEAVRFELRSLTYNKLETLNIIFCFACCLHCDKIRSNGLEKSNSVHNAKIRSYGLERSQLGTQ